MIIDDQLIVQVIAVFLQADIRRNWIRFRESDYPNLRERLYPYQVNCNHGTKVMQILMLVQSIANRIGEIS